MKNKKMKAPDFWKMARSYLHTYMPSVQSRSDKSVAAYRDSLNKYLSFLKEKYSVENEAVTFECFSRDYLIAFIVWMKEEKHYKPKTINLRMTAIRSFLKYCANENWELRDFSCTADDIPVVKVPKRSIEFLSGNAITAVLAAVPVDTTKHRRNRILLIVMYDTGARVAEMADLMVSSLHIDNRQPYVTLVGKGNKTRNVPLMEKTVAHLREYVKEFHPQKVENPLFYSRRDSKPHPLSTDSIELILKNAAAIAREQCMEVPDHVHCHLVRKTRAMELYKLGVSLPIIAQLLGHENVSTTAGFYAFATYDMMFKAMEKANSQAASVSKEWKNPDVMKTLYSLD